MRVHLAGQIGGKLPAEVLAKLESAGKATLPTSGAEMKLCQEMILAEQFDASLVTFAYPNDIKLWADLWLELPSSVIVDSGAFTAHTTGKEFTTATYSEFMTQIKTDYEPRLIALDFMSLDVIGDTAATWRNFDDLQARGHDVMPILTTGCTSADIDRAAEHRYIAIGGCVGAGRTALQPQLDQIFARLTRRDQLPQVHLLGVTQQWALERYPAYSCDSSSWKKPLIWGQSRLNGMRKIPSSTLNGTASYLASESLRAELRHYRKLQDHATALWRKRGIEWES